MHLKFVKHGPKLGPSKMGWYCKDDELVACQCVLCVTSSPLASGSQGDESDGPVLCGSRGPCKHHSISDERGRWPQCCGYQWGNCAAGLPIELCFSFFLGGWTKSAEWAVGSFCDCEGCCLEITSWFGRSLFRFVLGQIPHPGNIGNLIVWTMNMGSSKFEPSKMIEFHYGMPAGSDLVVRASWGYSMPSGDRGQMRPTPCWKEVHVWKRLDVRMGSACHMQGTPSLQGIDMC